MTHMTDDDIRALMSGAKSASGFFDMERAAPDLAAACLDRGAALSEAHGYAHDLEAKLIVAETELDAALARVKELEAQAKYDRDLIVDIRVALMKAQDAIIPTETLKRWANFPDYGMSDEIRAIIAQRENRNE